MKRLVSILLTLTMVISIAGCSKKSEETTKKTKTKKTSETETEETLPPESDTEETETETEETEEPTSSETEESTKPSKSGSSGLSDYTISPDFAIRSDLKKLDYIMTKEYRAYGFVASTEDNKIYSVTKDVDVLTIKDEDNYSQLWNSLDGIYPTLNTNYDELYDQKLPSYVDGSATGSFAVTSHTYVVRSDSDVFSFITYQNTYDLASSSDKTTYKVWNYRSGDSMEYILNDIVSDRPGFANFFAEYLDGAKSMKENPHLMQEVEYLAGKISDPNAEVPFLITYDGLFIIYTDDYEFNMFKIPACYAGDYIDMSLFGTTPETYALQSDVYDHIIWDVDGDGKMDKIIATSETDEYGCLINFGIAFNDKVESIPEDGLEISGLMLDKIYLLKTDDGFYAYADMYSEDAFPTVAVFKFDGSSFKFQNYFNNSLPSIHIDGFFFDPENFTIVSSTDIMGTGYVIENVSAKGNNGFPQKTQNLGGRYTIAATKQELSVDKFNSKGAPDGKATLPANAVFVVRGIDLESRTLLCEYLDADASKNFYFQLTVDPASGENDWSLKYNGIDQNDLFQGIFYAG